MAAVTFEGVGKVYPDGTRAVEDLNLDVRDGELMVFVGPSGCGKTSALRMVAGLEEISEGEIRIDGKTMNTVEPRQRDVAMVFQNYALYPHMSVFDNIAFPLRSRRMSKHEIRTQVERTAALLGLQDVLKRRPRTLSGGQRQRVAMGRAIVREPQAFLMDEPLSNLDAKLRVQMRAEISKLQRNLGVTTIYVTHDQVEAMTMGNRIAVMRKGTVQQEGPPQELYDHPANLFVASFIGSPGMNLFRARFERDGDGVCCVVGKQRLRLPANIGPGRASLASYVGRELAFGIRPEHLDAAMANSDQPSLRADVQLVETLGSERLVHAEIEAEPVLTDAVLEIARDTDAAVFQTLQQEASIHRLTLVARLSSESDIQPGSPTQIAVQPHHIHLFDLETGLAVV